ncbi:MAG: CBS domain-containing protein [Candidatus Kariarchaeaceae archaeon]
MSEKTVYDIATKHDIMEGAPNRTLESAILIMGTRNFRRLPITKLGKLRGILTVTDIIRAIAEKGLPDGFEEKISDWMTEKPKTVTSDTSISAAVELMSQGNFGSLLIVDEGSDLLRGIVTERDILRHFKDDSFTRKLSDLDQSMISRDLVKIQKSTSLIDAIKKMNEAGTHRMLTYDGDKLSGIVTANSITALCSVEREEIAANRNFLSSITVDFVATSNVITAEVDTKLSDAIDLMVKENIGTLPLTKDGEIVGIFSERTLIHVLGKMK